jgi:hypothetical protein
MLKPNQNDLGPAPAPDPALTLILRIPILLPKQNSSIHVFCTIKGKWVEPEPGMEPHHFPILEPHHNDLFPAPAPSADPLA